MRPAKPCSLACLATGLLIATTPLSGAAQSVSISADVLTLAAPGRYEYRYTVTNVSLATPVSWFSIDFDTALFNEASLSITSVGRADWSQRLLVSVPVFDIPAQYDAYKTIGAGLGVGASEAGFAVQFTWLGGGLPGAQAFTVYDPSTLAILDSGLTAVVPEPTTAALLLMGLAALVTARRVSDAGLLTDQRT